MAAKFHLKRARKSLNGRRKVALTKSALRSAISNGRLLSPEIDQRGPLVRRLKDLISDHISDLAGDDAISHSERILVHRGAMLTLLAELTETGFIKSEAKVSPTAASNYIKLIGALRRTLVVLGLKRRMKQIGPTFGDLLREDLEQQEREAAERAEMREATDE